MNMGFVLYSKCRDFKIYVMSETALNDFILTNIILSNIYNKKYLINYYKNELSRKTSTKAKKYKNRGVLWERFFVIMDKYSVYM